MRLVWGLVLCTLLGCIAKPGPPVVPEPPLVPQPPLMEAASLEGRINIVGTLADGVRPEDAVVYLEAIRAPEAAVTPTIAEIRQHGGKLEPSFLVVARGQQLTLLNRDSIYHGAFSYSKPNGFDLGTYGPGEQRRVLLDRRGVVRLRCPLHDGERGIVFVAPGPLFTRPSRSGGYRIRGVPPGRYWLRVWSDGLAESSHEITLRAGETGRRTVALSALRD